MNKPVPCNTLGCSGAACKFHRAKNDYPYFFCVHPSLNRLSEDAQRQIEKDVRHRANKVFF
jgi:hypothetical protein